MPATNPFWTNHAERPRLPMLKRYDGFGTAIYLKDGSLRWLSRWELLLLRLRLTTVHRLDRKYRGRA